MGACDARPGLSSMATPAPLVTLFRHGRNPNAVDVAVLCIPVGAGLEARLTLPRVHAPLASAPVAAPAPQLLLEAPLRPPSQVPAISIAAPHTARIRGGAGKAPFHAVPALAGPAATRLGPRPGRACVTTHTQEPAADGAAQPPPETQHLICVGNLSASRRTRTGPTCGNSG